MPGPITTNCSVKPSLKMTGFLEILEHDSKQFMIYAKASSVFFCSFFLFFFLWVGSFDIASFFGHLKQNGLFLLTSPLYFLSSLLSPFSTLPFSTLLSLFFILGYPTSCFYFSTALSPKLETRQLKQL